MKTFFCSCSKNHNFVLKTGERASQKCTSINCWGWANPPESSVQVRGDGGEALWKVPSALSASPLQFTAFVHDIYEINKMREPLEPLLATECS